MRQGRYRYQMIEESKLKEWAPTLAPLFLDWQSLVRSGYWQDWEFVAHYLLAFVFLNRPMESWRSASTAPGADSTKLDPKLSKPSWFSMAENTAMVGFSQIVGASAAQRWPEAARWVYGSMNGLRGVPEKVLRSLRGWKAGTHDLVLCHHVPTAQELLAMQWQGRRCVSALVREEEILRPVEEGRDVWSFCLHDLLHASHFFDEAMGQESQRALSWFFLRLWKTPILLDLLQFDEVFAREFEYIAADMNAHPVYIFLSFYAKTLEAFKRQRGITLQRKLSDSEESLWQNWWLKLLVCANLSSHSLAILSRFMTIEDRVQRHQLLDRHWQDLGRHLCSSESSRAEFELFS